MIEKYNDLAREALSNGDKILSENYSQHADHFTRILNERENLKRERFLENKNEENNNATDEIASENHEVSKNNDEIIEKYNNLAREALSSGDKILSENYFQHADHFTRILDDQEKLKKLKNSNNIAANVEKSNEDSSSKDLNASNKTNSEVV